LIAVPNPGYRKSSNGNKENTGSQMGHTKKKDFITNSDFLRIIFYKYRIAAQ